jgi:hypothetical protein
MSGEYHWGIVVDEMTVNVIPDAMHEVLLDSAEGEREMMQLR